MRPQQPAADGSEDKAGHEPSRRSEKSPNSHVFLLEVSCAFAALGATPLLAHPTFNSVIMPVAI